MLRPPHHLHYCHLDLADALVYNAVEAELGSVYQRSYWDRVYEELGFSSLEDFLIGFWEGFSSTTAT